jgi:hypothetical protein
VLQQLQQPPKRPARAARPASPPRVHQNAAVTAGASEDARWVDAAWLASWADGAEAPPPIDNAPLLCEHGKLDPGKAAGGPASWYLFVTWRSHGAFR